MYLEIHKMRIPSSLQKKSVNQIFTILRDLEQGLNALFFVYNSLW